jgi:5-methylcytosine-specific restriction endonuclease McrA
MEELARYPFPCPNCSVTFADVKLFCSDLCKDEAKCVRYWRRCRADGRDEDPKVKEAIDIKLAHILNGGYDEAARRLPKSVRRLVIDRDGGRCQICGEPGTEIDHISGNSSALTNLQLLCNTCHNKKTVAQFRRITKESHPEKWATVQRLWRRARAAEPLLLCDDESWDSIRKELKRKRGDAMRKRRDAATRQAGLFE